MSWIKRIRANFAWFLFTAVVVVERYDWHKISMILLTAMLGTILTSLLDVANLRWPAPFRWPWSRRKRSDGSSL